MKIVEVEGKPAFILDEKVIRTPVELLLLRIIKSTPPIVWDYPKNVALFQMGEVEFSVKFTSDMEVESINTPKFSIHFTTE